MPESKDEKHGRPVDTEAPTVAGSSGPSTDLTLPPVSAAGPERDAAGVSLVGEAVGRYLLGERVGEGGMGVVYSAYDPQLDRAVAVKLVRIEGEDRRGRDELKARLLREARAMARLSHPNVVAVYDAGEWNDRVFLAMELVRGATTLKAWLRASPRSWREIVRVFVDAGRGIAAAHAAGIVHRDVKPDNILIDADGRARITDFGIAFAEDVAEPVEIAGVETPNLTRLGRIVGTPAYMAPEVFFGAAADARSDVFSFCVTLHVALYGQKPYPDNRIREGAFVQVVEPPAGTRVPARLRRAVLRGLSVRPDARPASMEALLAELERVTSRSSLGASIAAVVASVALVAIAAASRHPRESGVCGEMRPLAGAWDAETRSSIERAFVRADSATGAATWARASKGLQRTAEEWQAALGGACRADTGDGARAVRVACLEKQRDRFRTLASVLRDADADVVSHASSAAASLPRAVECESVRGLSMAAKLPADPEARHEIAALELRLAEASEQADAGKLASAIRAMEAIAARAGAIGYRPLEAEALFALGQARDDAGEAAEAIAALSRAEIVAEAAGDDRLAARAAAKLAYGAILAGRGEERDSWLTRAHAILERLGPDDRAEADVAFAEAWAAYDDEKNDASLAFAQRAATLRTRVLGPGHPDTLRADGSIAVALTKLGRFDESLAVYQETLRQLDASLGPAHPAAMRLLNSEALLLIRLGRFTEADAALARSLPLSEAVSRDTAPRAIALLAAANLRREQGKLDEALRFARLAEDAARASTGEKSGNYFACVGAEGEILLAQHDVRGALSALAKASANATDDCETNDFLGEAQLAAGRARDGLRTLEKANDEIPTQLQFPGTAARVRFDLARALVLAGGDRARARALAQQAREELATLPWRRDRLDEVDRWLADPRNAAR